MEEKNVFYSLDDIKKAFHVRKIKHAIFSNGKEIYGFNRENEGYYWELKEEKFIPLSSNLK